MDFLPEYIVSIYQYAAAAFVGMFAIFGIGKASSHDKAPTVLKKTADAIKKVVKPGTPWFTIAKSMNGLKEIVGKQHNAKVVQLYADVGHGWVKDDETAWCAAFVGSCLEKSGYRSTRSLRAKSYSTWGKKVSKPYPGCIVVLNRTKNPAFGHVGFYVGETATKVKVFGGNQGNAVNTRSLAKSRVCEYREPSMIRNSRTMLALGGATALGVASLTASAAGVSVSDTLPSSPSAALPQMVNDGLIFGKQSWDKFFAIIEKIVALAAMLAGLYYRHTDMKAGRR